MMVVEARKVGRTKDKASPKVRKWVMGLPERNLRREELDTARLFCFVPQKHFYGGYLVYALTVVGRRETVDGERANDRGPGTDDRARGESKGQSPGRYSPSFRQWVANYAARDLGVTFTAAI